jgi:hypothetical protein
MKIRYEEITKHTEQLSNLVKHCVKRQAGDSAGSTCNIRRLPMSVSAETPKLRDDSHVCIRRPRKSVAGDNLHGLCLDLVCVFRSCWIMSTEETGLFVTECLVFTCSDWVVTPE